MNFEDLKGLGVAVLYAIAAIFGLVGGCAVGVQQVLGAKKRAAFIMAYTLIGAVASLGFMASTHVFGALHGLQARTFHEIALYSMLVGGAVALTVFSANQTVKIIFKRLGLEVQFTTRKAEQERRSTDITIGIGEGE